ncbi:hypothetical protein J2W70_001723 [Pseudomonas koreensis]|nr:hypothetical protein [Pseudomonas koreensis]
METGQRDQQHRQQTAAQQGENLRSQGFLQHCKVLEAGMRHARADVRNGRTSLSSHRGKTPMARNLTHMRSARQSLP